MNTIKSDSQKSSKNIDWKLFFNMRIFRYTFINQLKSITTYVFVGLTIIIGTLLLCASYSWAETYIREEFKDLDIDNLKDKIKIPVSFYKLYLYILFILFFILFITFKSLQIFRDEMDDGTLLVFSSMPYSRFKLIIQKWLSLQVICLIFTLSVIFTLPIVFLTIQCFSMPSWEVTKILYKNSLNWTIGSIIFQILISTVAILISLFFGKTGTIGFLSVFSAMSIIMFISPMFVQNALLKDDSLQMNRKIQKLTEKPKQNDLFQYAKDPDLKDFFEIESWFTDKEIEDIINNKSTFIPKEIEFKFNHENYMTLHKLFGKYNFDESKMPQIWQDFSETDIRGNIVVSDSAPKAVKEIVNLFEKFEPETINVRSVRVNDFIEGKIDKNDQKLVKSKETYITALDNNDNLTKKEKKIVQLDKTLIEDYKQTNMKNIEFVNPSEGTTMMLFNFARVISIIAWDNEPLYKKLSAELQKIVQTKGMNGYFIDNPAFQNLSFFMKNLCQEILSNMYQFNSKPQDDKKEDIIKDKENVDKYLKFIKVNNYLNIMTQIDFIWNSQIDDVGHSLLHSLLLNNYYGEWEKKDINYKKADGTLAKIEALKLNPESFKRFISPNLLYIIYPLISLSLAGLLIYLVYKRDFV